MYNKNKSVLKLMKTLDFQTDKNISLLLQTLDLTNENNSLLEIYGSEILNSSITRLLINKMFILKGEKYVYSTYRENDFIELKKYMLKGTYLARRVKELKFNNLLSDKNISTNPMVLESFIKSVIGAIALMSIDSKEFALCNVNNKLIDNVVSKLLNFDCLYKDMGYTDVNLKVQKSNININNKKNQNVNSKVKKDNTACKISNDITNSNYKGILNALYIKKLIDKPIYQIVGIKNIKNVKIWTCSCKVDSIIETSNKNCRKKVDAEQDAASKVVKKLKQLHKEFF